MKTKYEISRKAQQARYLSLSPYKKQSIPAPIYSSISQTLSITLRQRSRRTHSTAWLYFLHFSNSTIGLICCEPNNGFIAGTRALGEWKP